MEVFVPALVVRGLKFIEGGGGKEIDAAALFNPGKYSRISDA